MTMRRALFAALSLVLASASAACDDGRSEPPAASSTPAAGRAIELRYDGGVLHVEIADTPDERSTGLMHRDSLAADAGMLFIFEAPRIPSFWMKDTLIPLDMLWIGADKRVVEIDADVQPEPGVADGELRRYGPEVAVAYGLEVNAGTAARLGLRPGSQLAFEVPAP